MKRFSMMAVIGTMVAAILMSVMVSLPVAAQAQGDGAQTVGNAELRKGAEEAQRQGNLQAAMKLSQQLEASEVHDGDWGYNGKFMANLLLQTKGAAAKVEFLRAAFEEAVALEGTVVTHRKQMLSSACYDSWAGDAHSVAMAELSIQYLGASEHSVGFLCRGYFGLKRYEDALAVLDKFPDAMPGDQTALRRLDALVALKRADAIPDAALAYIQVSADPIKAANALQFLLPGDDVALCVGLTAQQVLDVRKFELRRSTGRLAPDVLVGLANQLTKGGDDRPLRISDEARALANKLAAANADANSTSADTTATVNAPLAGYLQPLLTGDYKSAFRYAYTQAKVAETDAEYILWINAAAGAIRCADQCYNGRALAFIQYVNGTSATNPAASMEEEK